MQLYAADTMHDHKRHHIIEQLRKAGINRVKGKQLEQTKYRDLCFALTMHRAKED